MPRVENEMSENPYLAPQTNPIQETDDIARQMQGLQWPLSLSFKILALASQATVTDANGKVVCYTKQKLFKFREHVEIFTDKTRTTLLAEIKTKKIIDWSARYSFTDAQGGEIGSVGRKGWRSIWRAHYEVFNPGNESIEFSLREENAGAKFFLVVSTFGYATGRKRNERKPLPGPSDESHSRNRRYRAPNARASVAAESLV